MKFPRVKICGITRIEDALCAAGAGAHILGFIFYEKSPRYILPVEAAKIIDAVKKVFPELRFAGVFVNARASEVADTVETAGLTEVQLHGDEGPGDVDKQKVLLEERGHDNVSIIKAFRIRDVEDVTKALEYRADYYLFDAFVEGERGGTGHVFNWELLRDFPKMEILFLSGGINRDNVLDALQKVSPLGLDLSSSVEASPGLKDCKKIEDFMDILKMTE